METIVKFVKVNDEKLGYEIHTDEQVITCLISNYGNCCEDWGFITTEDLLSDYVGAELLSINLIDTDYKTHPLAKDFIDAYEIAFCFIDVVTSKGTLQFAIYNQHNGYYGHDVKIESKQLTYQVSL